MARVRGAGGGIASEVPGVMSTIIGDRDGGGRAFSICLAIHASIAFEISDVNVGGPIAQF